MRSPVTGDDELCRDTHATSVSRSRRSAAGALLAALLFAVGAPAAIAATAPDKQNLYSFETGDPIQGGFSMTTRDDDSIATRIRTRATPGHAVTVW
jgi:hypothetical protein